MATHGGICVRIESATDRRAMGIYGRTQTASVLSPQQHAGSRAPTVQPIKQVASEHICGDVGLQVTIGGGDHPNIGANRSSSPDALKFGFLQHSQ